MSGTLKVNIKQATNLPRSDLNGCSAMVKISIPNQTPAVSQLARTKNPNQRNLTYNENLVIQCQKVPAAAEVEIKVITSDNVVLGSAIDSFENIALSNPVTKNYDLRNESNQPAGKVSIVYIWAEQEREVKKAKTDAAKEVKPETPSHALTPAPEGRRPKLLRVSYYYETGKYVYDYATSFKFIQPLANFGESSTNYVLGKIGFQKFESTKAIDDQIVPLLDTVDTKVDETLAGIMDILVKSQNKILETKDKAVGKVSEAASATKSKVAEAANATKSTVRQATSSTVETVQHASSSTYQTMSGAAASTYKTVSGAAVYLLSYVPVVGKKVMT